LLYKRAEGTLLGMPRILMHTDLIEVIWRADGPDNDRALARQTSRHQDLPIVQAVYHHLPTDHQAASWCKTRR
jgi:hypothetical protein